MSAAQTMLWSRLCALLLFRVQDQLVASSYTLAVENNVHLHHVPGPSDIYLGIHVTAILFAKSQTVHTSRRGLNRAFVIECTNGRMAVLICKSVVLFLYNALRD